MSVCVKPGKEDGGQQTVGRHGNPQASPSTWLCKVISGNDASIPLLSCALPSSLCTIFRPYARTSSAREIRRDTWFQGCGVPFRSAVCASPGHSGRQAGHAFAAAAPGSIGHDVILQLAQVRPPDTPLSRATRPSPAHRRFRSLCGLSSHSCICMRPELTARVSLAQRSDGARRLRRRAVMVDLANRSKSPGCAGTFKGSTSAFSVCPFSLFASSSR